MIHSLICTTAYNIYCIIMRIVVSFEEVFCCVVTLYLKNSKQDAQK